LKEGKKGGTKESVETDRVLESTTLQRRWLNRDQVKSAELNRIRN
jgi:hypothetical protein